ncbi:MAG: hypothetical protein ABWY06_17655 [Pseudomonas sp.]|uniref:hypothetical protein n=1 Tax=Pseudomonas sp. TaxID=306 RepID=UPI0033936D62
MKQSIPAFTLSAMSLSLLLASASAMADDNPIAQPNLKAAPNAGQPHTLQVKLDAQGDWTVVPSSTVRMRFQYGHHWLAQPNKGNSLWARIYVGEAKIAKGDTNFYDKTQMFDLSSAQVLANSGTLNANLPFSLLVVDGIPGTNIASHCGFEKDNRLKQGKGLNQVLRNGFNVKLNTQLSMAGFYDLGGGPNTSRPVSSHQYHVQTTAPVTLQCLGNPAIADQVAPPKGPQGLVGPFKVDSVELIALPYKTTTVCPIEIAFKATVKGVGGGEIKYWLEEQGGLGAAVQQISNLPGNLGEASERVILQKVSIKPGPVQQPQGLDNLKANTQGSLVQRRFRFHVLAPNKLQSSQVEIQLTCTSTLSGGLSAMGGELRVPPLQPHPPQPPKPGLTLQAAPSEPQPPQPEMKLQAAPAQPQPPKPELHLQVAPVEPQPAKPELHLQAAPAAPQPPKPALTLQSAPSSASPARLQLQAVQPPAPQPQRGMRLQAQPGNPALPRQGRLPQP